MSFEYGFYSVLTKTETVWNKSVQWQSMWPIRIDRQTDGRRNMHGNVTISFTIGM